MEAPTIRASRSRPRMARASRSGLRTVRAPALAAREAPPRRAAPAVGLRWARVGGQGRLARPVPAPRAQGAAPVVPVPAPRAQGAAPVVPVPAPRAQGGAPVVPVPESTPARAHPTA